MGRLLLLALLCFCLHTAQGHRTRGPLFKSSAASKSVDVKSSGDYSDALYHPDVDRLREHLDKLTSEPRLFGTPGGLRGAKYIAEQLTAALAGTPATVEVEDFTALSNVPRSVSVSFAASADGPFTNLTVWEPPLLNDDPTSGQGTPLFNGYAANSDSVGARPVVYINYCRKEDFDYAIKRNITVTGNVVLCRYGGIFRGQKAYFAEKYGAVALLLYSDPADDGYIVGAEYPLGPARSGDGGQRGTLAYGWLCPGDPSPERIATGVCGNATHLIPTIPVQPLGWSQAQKILNLLQGPYVSSMDGWQGAVPLHYRFGPGPVVARLDLDFDYAMRPGQNVIGRLAGVNSSHTVVLGCHHDAWVHGASDPLSGIAVLLETARLFGVMYSKGWRPVRSLVFVAWDGEEYGLLGSTYHVDVNAEKISKDMLAYVNIDGIVGTWFQENISLNIETSPLLAAVLTDAMSKTPSPNVFNASLLDANFNGVFSVLGDGSDFAALADKTGVSCASLGFDNGHGSPQYHSVYDSMHLMTTFSDPEFRVHQASTTLSGLIMYALSTDSLIRWDANTSATSIAAMQQTLLSQFPRASSGDWSRFNTALTAYQVLAAAVQEHVNSQWAANRGSSGAFFNGTAFNTAFAQLERSFLLKGGLPGRPYYAHQLQAPNVLNNYDSQVLPNVAYWATEDTYDAIALQSAIDSLTAALLNATDQLRQVGDYSPLSPRTVAGIVIGVILASIVIAMVIFWLVPKLRKKRTQGFQQLPE